MLGGRYLAHSYLYFSLYILNTLSLYVYVLIIVSFISFLQSPQVLFSDNFLKSFQKLKSVRTKKSVISLLLKISNGWRPKKFSVICESSSQIIKQFKVEGLYIVCANDIVKEWSDMAEELRYSQVLKIWDILPIEDIPKLVKRLDSMFGKYTVHFINCCQEKCLEGYVCHFSFF